MTIPKITVLIPVYNGMPFVVDAVESVLNQTFQDFELLIINDGSTDGTADFLNSLRDNRIRIIHQENRGYLRTINSGFQGASAEWVARLDADDIALSNRLEKQYEFILAHPNMAAVFSSYRRIGESGKTLGTYILKKEVINSPMLYGFVTHSTMLCNKAAFSSVGGYREKAYPEDDLDLTLRLQERYKLGVIEAPLIEYRFLTQSFTPNHIGLINFMKRYVRSCAVERRKGKPEPSLLQFLEKDLELPFYKRLFWMLEGQGELYRRLALAYMLGGQTLRGLLFVPLITLISPIHTFKRITSLLIGFTNRLLNQKDT